MQGVGVMYVEKYEFSVSWIEIKTDIFLVFIPQYVFSYELKTSINKITKNLMDTS